MKTFLVYFLFIIWLMSIISAIIFADLFYKKKRCDKKNSTPLFVIKATGMLVFDLVLLTICVELLRYIIVGEGTTDLYTNTFLHCRQFLESIWDTPYIIFAYIIVLIVSFAVIFVNAIFGNEALERIYYMLNDMLRDV